MKYFKLIEASLILSAKDEVRDALIALKIQGVKQVKTSQVLKDFEDKGSPISYEDLVAYIGQDPIISSINKNFITFKEEEKEEYQEPIKVNLEKSEVHKMANTALQKRIK